MRGGQLVPLPAPAEQREAGHVGVVVDGPVGVTERVRALAAAVGLDPLVDLAVVALRPAGATVSPTGKEPYGLIPLARRSAPITPA